MYDSLGNLLSELEESNLHGGGFIIASRSTNTYDNAGNRLTSSEEIWSDTNKPYIWKHKFTYDKFGNVLTDIHDELPEFSKDWINQYSAIFTYDNNGNCVKVESHQLPGGIPQSQTFEIWYNYHTNYERCNTANGEIEYILIK
jgi:hypothetical protein